MSNFKSCFGMLFQFATGFFAWMILSITISLILAYLAFDILAYLSGSFQLVVGGGVILLTFIIKKFRWMGYGIIGAMLFFFVGAFIRSYCMPPFMFPFPLSLISAC